MIDIIDLYQQEEINRALGNATEAKNKAERSVTEISDLKRKADALTIACQALWEIVKSQSNLEDSVLLKKMQEIDGRDGKIDGKISKTLLTCSKCKRKTNSQRTQCLYCGHKLEGGHVFEKT